MRLDGVFCSLKIANLQIEEEIRQAVCAVIESGCYLHGKQTEALEAAVANLCGAKHCIAVSNGFDALSLIIQAYKVMGVFHDGDEVIVPANSFVASALAVSSNGLVPRFCDISSQTLNIDTSLIPSLINDRTVAIMPVHLYGTPTWDKHIMQIAQSHNLIIIEDNAQAIGAKASMPGINGGRTTGALGHAAGISFYPTKNLGAIGDAGAVTTCDDSLAETVRALANYGGAVRYKYEHLGRNCRIDEVQAAALNVKMRHLSRDVNRRRCVAKAYFDVLSASTTPNFIAAPNFIAGTEQVWHQYPVRVAAQHRDELRKRLAQLGIATDIHYPIPINRQQCYANATDSRGANIALPMPVAEQIANELISLPIAAPIEGPDARIIAATLLNVAKEL